MGLRVGMRIEEGHRRGTVLAPTSKGFVKVAWDDGSAGHRPVTALTALGKNGERR